ncbi:glycoside hydrolase superfamily [Scheffersomyces xylosifermentans]|uniref:glycoside hydrolase superfamily n=1 Tax=Scheffersomyces xylosifermentans TaxID=1304137 RepID=UPI00315DA837
MILPLNILYAVAVLTFLKGSFATSDINFNIEGNPRLVPETLAHTNYSFPDCENGPLKDNLVCDFHADPYDRARAVVSLFTLEELFNNTGNTSPGVPRLGLPPYQWWSEGLHGIANSPGVKYAPSGEYSSSTSFPQPILMSAAFDDYLIQQVAEVISTEGRAFNNFGQSGLDYWTPNINPFRDPRWGRGQETPGEDPFHISQYVYSLILGLQGGIEPNNLKVAATCKHFAGYDIENWNNHSRLGYNAIISEQDLSDYFLVPFQSCVRDAKAASTMCSYNAVNGVPVCASEYFLNNVLREYLNFGEGVITSDCNAIYNIWNPHQYASSQAVAAADALKAGVDVNCGVTYQDYLPEAFNNGSITQEDVTTALVRQYGTLVRLGYFDPPQNQSYRQLGWKDVNTPQAQQLAYQAAVEGITLLKNDGTLPLSKKIRKIAFIGPWANATSQMQGNYEGDAPYLISPIQAAIDAKFDVQYSIGTLIDSNSTANFTEAINIAKSADAIIFAGGIDNTIEAEAQDRESIAWPGNQLELVSQLSQLRKPLIVLQMGGGQIDDSELKSNNAVNAILWGGYPGQSGGKALLDIITGVAAPSGRLPATQYPASYADEVDMTDMSVRPGPGNPGRTYMWYTGTPVYEFGYGLHYTTFSAAPVKQPHTTQTFDIQSLIANARYNVEYIDQALLTTFEVNIQNTGKVVSDYSALLFAQSQVGPPPYRQKELVSYTKLHGIKPNQKVIATLPVKIGTLGTVDELGDRYLYPGTYTFSVDVDNKATFSVTLTGEKQLLSALPQNK